MGHQVIIYGMIECPAAGDQGRRLKAINESTINSLPAEDEWPCLTRSMFALPSGWPHGTYREQIIHFGLSMKNEKSSAQDSSVDLPVGTTFNNDAASFIWTTKFERLLRSLFWFGATLHINAEFERRIVLFYRPTSVAIEGMLSEKPLPISEWERKHFEMPEAAE